MMTHPVSSLLPQLMRVTFLRYAVASVVALAADMGLFMALLAMNWHPAGASATSYAAGIGIHWLISSRLVFVAGARTIGMVRVRQKALFIVSALVGLAITVGIVAAGQGVGIDPRLSKLAAIGASFIATYYLRKTLVFANS